ncbi:MAG: hypothetical protein K0B07_02095 [DPANN group archaeon]|nr:hypothetical protein [DPANN group archaeon]
MHRHRSLIRNKTILLSSVLIIILYLSSLGFAVSAGPKILIVADSDADNTNYTSYYTDALVRNNYKFGTDYDIKWVSGYDNGPTYEFMSDYDIVIWFTGTDLANTLTSTDISNIQTYLNNGGALFMSSTYAAFLQYESYQTFFNNYMNIKKPTVGWLIEYVSNSYPLTIYGTNPIYTSSLKFNHSVYYPAKVISRVNASNDSKSYNLFYFNKDSSFSDNSNQISSSTYNTIATASDLPTHKVVYFGLGFESIISPYKSINNGGANPSETDHAIARATLMKNIINYLYTPLSYISSISPDPTKDNITITAICSDNGLLSNINASEFYFNTDNLSDGNNIQLTATDGTFNTSLEEATITINATAPPYNLDDGTHTVSVHCQDSAGHWSKYDNKTFIINRTVPQTPEITINNGNNYTNDYNLKIHISEIIGSGTFSIELSCNDIDFWSVAFFYNYVYINLDDYTYDANGCNTTDGLKTIYLRAKSEAGVENTTHASDSITLDTINPEFISVDVSNPDSYYKAGDNISLDIDMGETDLILYANTSNVDGNFTLQPLNDDGDNTYSLNISMVYETMKEGTKTINLKAEDLAGNSPGWYNSLLVTIDKTKPNIPSYFENNDGYTNDMTPEMAFKPLTTNTPDYISFSCDNDTFDSWLPFSSTSSNSYNNFNITNTTYGCSPTDGERTIYIRSKDIAGNINTSLSYTIIYDSVLPEIDNLLPSNKSNITHNTQFYVNVSDDRYLFEGYYESTGDSIFIPVISQGLTYANYSFKPTWYEDDGNKNIIFRIYDMAGNILQSLYSYMVDSTAPETEDNYTSSDWVGSDQQVSLDCTDSQSYCNTTYYCISETSVGGCEPESIGNNVDVGCTIGHSCIKIIYYYSIDNSGNVESIDSTEQIKIDKTPPIITVTNPKSGKTYASTVDIFTDIIDSDNGTISYADYIIYNSSQVNIANGSLNSTDGWVAEWNSSDYTTGTFNLTIFANDSLGNNITYSHQFSIDNDLPSAIIFYPNEIYTNATSITLNLNAQKDTGNIDNCSYNIYNSSGIQNNSEKIAVASQECIFDNSVDISSWADGNYSITFTAIDLLSNQANDVSWFYKDRIKPDVHINTQLNNTWNKGLVSINYNATDEMQISACKTRFKKNSTTPWSSYTSIACGNEKTYHFDTIQCSDTSSNECLIEFYAEDSAGNTNNSQVLYLNIDNSPPQVSFTSPPATSWFNSNFTVVHNETDPQGMNCSYKITGSSSSGWKTLTCSQNISVNISSYCNISGTACIVYINSTNNAGTTIETSRTFYTDFDAPQLSGLTHTPHVAKDGTEIYFNATISDTNRPIGSVIAYILNTTGEVVSQIQMTQINPTSKYNGTYIVTGSETGTFTINITANDTLGNLAYDNTITFLVKNTPPTASAYNLSVDIDSNYGDRRILTGDQVTFSVNLSDSIGVDSAIMTLKQSGYDGVNYTLTPESYIFTSDIWSTTITDTANRTNYSIYNLYVNDTLGNTKIISPETINLNFISVVPQTQIILDSLSNTTIAETTVLFNLTVNFNKTMSDTTFTVYIPPNTKTSNTLVPAYTNSTPYQCIVPVGTCALEPTFDTANNTISITLNLTGPATEVSLITQNIKSNVESIDKVYNWQVIYDSVDYGTSSKIITPNLNITSVNCDNSYPCRINQNTSFNISVNVTNEYDIINHTGNFYNLSIIYSIDGTDQTINLNDIFSGNSKNTTFYDLIEEPGTYSFTIYATDNISSSYSIDETYSIEIVDTMAPTFVSVYSFTGNIIYLNKTKTMYYNLKDNVGIDTVWATVSMPDLSKSNITMEFTSGTPKEGQWQLDYNETSQYGIYNITTIYVNDTENNTLTYLSDYTFEVRDMDISISLNTTSLSVEETLQINVTIENNISSIGSVLANITKPRGAIEQVTLSFINISDTNITYYSGTYSNITQSDNYTIEVIVSAGGDMSETSSFFAEYGTVNIVSAIGLNNTLMIPVDKIYNHSWYIYPVKGDLVNVNATMHITDETLLNFSVSEIILKQLGNISYETYKGGYLISWELNTTQIGLSDIDVTVSSTYSTNLTSTEINVTVEDIEYPVLGNYSSYSIVNLNDILAITVDAQDNTFVKSVIVEVTDPNHTKTNVTAQISDIGEYTAIFENTTYLGNYSYDVYVSDISDNNVTSVNSKAFNVTDIYHIDIVPNYVVYNKGETIDIYVIVYDINNHSVSSFNLSLDLVKGDTVLLVNNTINSSAQYKILTSDLPTELDKDKFSLYTFNANVSKDGNLGNISSSVNVTNHLVTRFIDLSPGQYYSSSSKVPVTISVTNIRGEETQESIVSVACTGCLPENEIDIKSLTKISANTYVSLENFIAPSSEKNFYLDILAVDIYKNGDTDAKPTSILLTTDSYFNTQNNAEGAGGVSSAISDVQNFIQNQLDKVFQIPTDDFVFTSDTKINIITGETAESLTSIENIGDTGLHLIVDYNLDCCTVDMLDKFTLELNERRSIPITISSNLSKIPGRYKLDIGIMSENISKEYTIIVNLIQNTLIVQLDSYKQDYVRLRNLIDDLNFLGIDTSLYEESLRFSKDLIADAQKAIDSNDIEELGSINTKLDKGLGNLDRELADKESLKWILENKYSIAGTVITLLILIYLLQGYFVPFISLTHELKELHKKESNLSSEEKATEKEYFTRVIDKPTFNKIMTEKHKALIDARTHITHLSVLRSRLIHGHAIYSDEINNDKIINAATKKKLLKHFNKESSIVPKNVISMISDLKNNVNFAPKKLVLNNTGLGTQLQNPAMSENLKKIKAEILSGPLDDIVSVDVSESTEIPDMKSSEPLKLPETQKQESSLTPDLDTEAVPVSDISEDAILTDDSEFKRLMAKLKKDMAD